MSDQSPTYAPDDAAATECYCRAMQVLKAGGIKFLVGGAYAFARYTGIPRHTKDLDLFLRRADCDEALAVLAAEGYATEMLFDHWLAKAYCGEYFIDIIFGSGNGIAVVDDSWFEHAIEDEVLDERVLLCPPEESIWSKAFVMERHRFDGADIAHMFRAMGDKLDWQRLLDRFAVDWRVLYAHVVLFEYIYPNERWRIPAWALDEFAKRIRHERKSKPIDGRVCRGTVLSATQYLPDIEHWGYRDGRISPNGNMTARQASDWTDGVLTGQ